MNGDIVLDDLCTTVKLYMNPELKIIWSPLEKQDQFPLTICTYDLIVIYYNASPVGVNVLVMSIVRSSEIN